MALSFRTARKLWLGLVALLSLACIFLAVVLWLHGYSKSNNFGALVAIPCFAFVGAIWSIFKKTFFSPQIVCIEATWVFALLPFQIRKSGTAWYIGSLTVCLPVLGLFALESDSAIRSDFSAIYETLVALVWTNSALVFIYAAGIISLALLTQLSCDQEIWMRDIDSSILADSRTGLGKVHLSLRYLVWELKARIMWRGHNRPFLYVYRP